MSRSEDDWKKLKDDIRRAVAGHGGDAALSGEVLDLLEGAGLCAESEDEHIIFRRGKRLWQEVVDSNPDLIAVLDSEGVFRRLNKTLARALSLHPRQVVNRPWREVLPASDSLSDLFTGVEQLMLAGGGSFENTDTQTGQIYQVAVKPIRGGGWRPLFAVQVRDISMRRMREQKLRQSHDILQRARDVIMLVDQNGFFTSVSPSVTNLTGYTQAEVVGRHYASFVHPEERVKVHRFLLRLAERYASGASSGDAATLEFTLCPKGVGPDGFRQVELIMQPLHEGGRFMGFQGIVRDVTERKHAAEALRKGEERYRNLVETMHEGLISIDRSGRIDYVNSACEALLGRTGAELATLSWTDLLEGRGGVIMSRILERFRTGRTRPVTCRLSFLSSSGQKVHTRVSIQPRQDGQGQFQAAIMVISDISEIRRLERRLKSALQGAKAANSAKSEFLAGMSHEIRTPLNAIIGLTGLLSGSELTERQKSLVDLVGTSSRNLLELIDSVLDLSKIEAGKMELEVIDFELRGLLRSQVDVFGPRAQEKGIELLLEVAPDVPEYVRGDPVRLGQVLANLLSNAQKFTPSGHIRVRVARVIIEDRPCLAFEVEDTGEGIAPGNLRRIFEAFSQEDGSITRRHGGTGLGLTISRRLVQLMDGRIGVRSEQGRGSVFYFHIPCLPGAAPVERRELRPEAAAPVTGLRVLAAEDNASNRLVLGSLLEARGHAALLVEDGAQAVEAARKGGFDVIILDVRMPVMDGITAAREIRAFDRTTPIVALTADALKATQDICLAAGANRFLTKPIDPARLMAVLAELTSSAASASAPAPVDAPAPPPAEPAAGPVLFDQQEFLERLGGNAEIMRVILANFFQGDGPQMLADLRRHLDDGALAEVRDVAHKLKGATGNMSFQAMRETALRLERAASGDGGGTGGCAAAFTDLEHLYERTREAVTPLLPAGA